jgi:hypothetical protein
MSNELGVNTDFVIESLSRQVAVQAQRIAVLEAVIRQASSKKDEPEIILPNG